MLTTPVHLSGSTSGRAILVAETSTPGTLIHTAVSGTTDFDEITLWATNSDSSDRLLTIEWGGVTSPNDLIQQTIPLKSGANTIVLGRLNGGVVVRAFAASANVITIGGFINRMTA